MGEIVDGTALGLIVGVDDVGSIVGILVFVKVGEDDGRLVVGTLIGFEVGSPVEGLTEGS